MMNIHTGSLFLIVYLSTKAIAIPITSSVLLTRQSDQENYNSPTADLANFVADPRVRAPQFLSPTVTVRNAANHSNSSKVWYLPSNFTMDLFNISHWAWGQKENFALLTSIPEPDGQMGGAQNASIPGPNKDLVMQVRYPKGSVNPDSTTTPLGGIGFYASPLDVSKASNVSLYYSVFFPSDFDFGQGGKLPGLYGGATHCSGGVDSDDCFSTRLMFRTNGTGELYLYAPKGRQVPSLCQTPPLSDCNADYGYSIGRGAWSFNRGGWTNVRQDIWLNNADANDGGFNIWIDGRLVLHSDQVYYRHPDGPRPQNATTAQSPTDPEQESGTSSSPNEFMQIRPDNSPSTSPTSLGMYNPIGNNTPEGFTGIGDSEAMVSKRSSLPSNLHVATTPNHATLARRLDLQSRDVTKSNVTTILGPDMPTTANQTNSKSAESLRQGDLRDVSDIKSGLVRETAGHPEQNETIQFLGMMFNSFFGGHDPSWGSSKNQSSYFNRFGMVINH